MGKKIEYRFVHTADWHFGATRKLTPGTTEYLDRQRAVFNKLIAYVKDPKNKIDFVLVSGDLFENKGTTIPEFIMAYQIFKEIGVPVIATAGNHDELRVGEFQTLWLQMMALPNVTFVSEAKTHTLTVRGRPIEILACPWTGIKEQDEFDRHVMERLGGLTEIVMLHECFNGSILDNGKRFPFGVQVPDIPGIRYFACGDIHKVQRLNVKHAWFSGAPMQYTFGDDPEKGFLVVTSYEDIPEMETKFERLVSDIELVNITDPKQIDPNSSDWYKLECAADKIPLERPKNLKRISPLPIRQIVTEHTEHDKNVTAQQIRIDYSEGVDQVLGDLSYTPDEINREAEHIRGLARV